MFNIPIDLSYYKNILMIGVGGGFDIYGGLPVILSASHKNWILANYNIKLNEMQQVSDKSNHPESKLYSWLNEQNINIPVYGLPRVGVRHMKQCLQSILDMHNIDCVILVDGGVDSLMHGDEYDHGTILEDTIVITAASELPLPETSKYLICMGFGTELVEGLCHHHVLQNMAELFKINAFWGCTALAQEMPVFKRYKEACEFGWAEGRKSHIQTQVISAVLGEFGSTNLYQDVNAQLAGQENKNYLTPLMSIYWFFDLMPIVKNNKLSPIIAKSNTHTDALMLLRQNYIKNKPSCPLPY